MLLLGAADMPWIWVVGGPMLLLGVADMPWIWVVGEPMLLLGVADISWDLRMALMGLGMALMGPPAFRKSSQSPLHLNQCAVCWQCLVASSFLICRVA